jgi:hypothetical protein
MRKYITVIFHEYWTSMNLLPSARQKIIHKLWETYLSSVPQARRIITFLHEYNQRNCILDHLAIIDLPGSYSGIPYLSQLFSQIGFNVAGGGYLPDKQNDFAWLTECNAKGQLSHHVLPQIVIADFRLQELPLPIRKIIEKYVRYIPPHSSSAFTNRCEQLANGDTQALEDVVTLLEQTCSGRAWPTPTLNDFETVREANELLAWTLVFGRRPNHFGISVHHMKNFNQLNEFNEFMKQKAEIQFNHRENEIKGNAAMGITQSSTADDIITVQLEDAAIEIPAPFMEFVWRYHVSANTQPSLWEDYFVGFYAENANKVIESVYEQ